MANRVNTTSSLIEADTGVLCYEKVSLYIKIISLLFGSINTKKRQKTSMIHLQSGKIEEYEYITYN